MKRMSIMMAGVLAIAGCATVATDTDYGKAALALLKNDFKSKGPATMERMLNQDEAQRLCSEYPSERPKDVAAQIEANQMKTIKYPSDGKYLGKWQDGEKIAQNGRGMQSSDKVGDANGGNCYACHQITKEEISFGNIGPSLYNYGKLRGNSDEIMKYTWGKIYNSQAYSACSNMPRFGHSGILTEAQIKDVMALLLDPASPANK
ncbi:MAG TPA: sulfur oxidation c-type cytochrome SoxX [Burkholderiaceae bacterium]|uniref:sulfur oxidation c-type cytochrome SoxX n=1 Tax=Noviherbaspirillum sp. TaxID=1926288 RepID=UPI002B45A534|nr:sulfur oxidation c-type cytochrome SoxX [Noviherbaspirillum sp.]HJV02866.1 sulfur oxidation c-type cytochrome SoxX [Burkholderiaceae bacterium]HJV83766.1 sulfur oxidation c-type cytochrome SoxX [Noviherbaspirillum sp.]